MTSKPLEYIQADTDFFRSQRVLRVARTLNIHRAQAVGHMLELYAWATANHPDGLVRGPDASLEIEHAVEWDGPADAFVTAACDHPDGRAGLLERTPEGIRIRGWERYAKNLQERVRRTAQAAVKRAGWTVNGDGTYTDPQGKVWDDVHAAALSARGNRAPRQVLAPRTVSKPLRVVPDDAGGCRADVEPPHPADAPEAFQEARTDPAPTAPTPPPPAPPPIAPSAKTRAPRAPADRSRSERATGIQAVWNEVAPPLGLQRWAELSPARVNAACAHLDVVPDLDVWRRWLRQELAKPFNRGENERQWKADVSWFLRARTRDMVADFAASAKPAPAARATPPPRPARFPASLGVGYSRAPTA